VKLESKASEEMQESTHVEPFDDTQGLTSGDDTLLGKIISIATWRVKKATSST